MGREQAGHYWEDRGLMLLWFSLLAAPAAWALDQLISYAAVKPVCFADAKYALAAINAAALALVTIAGLTGRTCLRRAREGTDDGPRQVDRSHFMAIAAISLNVLVALLMLFATIPLLVLSPCE